MANAAPTVRPMHAARSTGSKCRKLEKITHRPTATHRQAKARRQVVKNLPRSFRILSALHDGTNDAGGP